MGTLRRISAIAALLCGGLALAAPNDFRIQLLGNPTDPAKAATANANFQAFAKEMGAALASSYLTPPSTLGHSGFAVSAELSVISLKGLSPGEDPKTGPPKCDPMDTKTECRFFIMPTESTYSGTSLLPSIHIRKGLPWSFEIGTKVGWIDRSNMAVATFDAKWAGNEGFAYLPDVSARIHVTRLFNTRDFELGSGGLDLSVGKKWAIGGMITLTPYGGWDLTWVGASTNRLVEFNEARTEAQAYATQYGQLLTNSGKYAEVALFANEHNRFYGGVRFVGGIIQIIAEVSAAALGDVTIPGTNTKMPLPPVLAFNVGLGLDF